MLIAAVLTLTPTRPAAVPASLGRAVQAWFLGQVCRHDPALARALHEPNRERPYTVSNLWGGGRPQNDTVQLDPERPVYLRLTSCLPALSDLLLERLLPDAPETISLAGATLRVTGRTTDPTQSVWAGRAICEALVQTHTLSPQLPRRLTLRFASPTVFRSQDAYLPFPLPRLVFEGLVRRWNGSSPIQIHPDVNRYADECMAISRYRLHTERVSFDPAGERGTMPGFVGSCSYSFRVQDRYWMGLAHLLAAFAFYAGVGKGTAMGLGQVRVLEGPVTGDL